MSTSSPTLGFIGLGVMGHAMAARLHERFGPLTVYSRRKSSAAPLLEAGAVWADSPAGLAAACDIIFTMVGYPEDVEEVYFGPEGLMRSLRAGTVLVDFTTSRPDLAARIAEAATAKQAAALDAPVSGGDIGAKNGTLSIMCGGLPEAMEQVRPFLEALGHSIVHQGPAGSGQHCKLCNQITAAANMVGVCEALAYAQAAGLDPQTVLRSIQGGAAGSWLLTHLAPRMLAGDFAPGFYVKHFIKDLRIARDSARQLGRDLPGLDLTLARYEALAERGFADSGTQALHQLYQGTAPC